MKHPESTPTLDVTGHYPLRLVEHYGQKALELDLTGSTTDRFFVKHLQAHVRLEVNGTSIAPSESREEAEYEKKLHFVLPPTPVHTLQLSFGKQLISEVKVDEDGRRLSASTDHTMYQLGLSETRALGMKLQPEMLERIPYPRSQRIGFDPKKHQPITDLHTHASAQIKAEDLLQVAYEADRAALKNGGEPICYPMELLKLLKVTPDKALDGERNQQVVLMVGRTFNPMRDEGLDCEVEGKKCYGVRISELSPRQRAAIIAKMRIAPDDTMAFSDFDREMYRYRNPLVKHPDLAKATIKKIAEDYAAMGVTYAELSTGSMTNPAWFRSMTEALDEIERDGVGPDHTRVRLRFLVGLPRNVSPQETMISLESAKYLARHPYIVGVDLLGYESNKTSDFHWAFSNLAQWAKAGENTDLKPDQGWNFMRDFIIRVHAGETEKNPGNVEDAIALAHRYNVRVRLGHALNYKLSNHGQQMLGDLISWGKDRIATERCMESNQVYRTKKLVHNQPPTIDAPCFLGTDGGGAIGSTPRTLAYSALAAGWSLKDLAAAQQHERGYIDRQLEREDAKTLAFESRYGKGTNGLDAFLDGYQKHMATIPDKAGLRDFLPGVFTTNKKIPILIGGASGSSWRDSVEKSDQATVERITEFLVRVLDPKKVYFVLGRVQKDGVSKVLDKAVVDYNDKHPTAKFAVLGRFNGAMKEPTGDLAESMTWIQDIPGGRDGVPPNMMRFIDKHKGKAVFFAGSDFTAEMVSLAADKRVPHALHVPKRGRLREEAETAETQSTFSDVREFVTNVFSKTGPGHLFSSAEEMQSMLRPEVNLKATLAEVEKLGLSSHRDRALTRVATSPMRA